MMSSMCSMPTDTRISSGAYAGRRAFALAELLVGGRGGVDDQGLGIAHVGQVAGQLDELMNLRPAASPPRMPKLSTAPKPFLK
jgi:hypothetical protein